jgi:hypothetical protein
MIEGGLARMKLRWREDAVLLFLTIFLALPFQAPAEGMERSTSLKVEGAYYFDNNEGYGVSDGGFAPISYSPVEPPGVTFNGNDQGRELGSGWGSAKIQVLLNHTIKVPYLTGPGPLTSGNNLAFSITGALTPVSTRFELETTLTPIAFLNVYAGIMLGTGWDIGLFNGMGLNADGSGEPESASFQGVVTNLWIGGTFQFDLAALVPGDWTHVVIFLSPKLQHACFSGADKEEAWMWEADIGENFNGFKCFGSYFLGYQMPLILDTVGLLLETERNLGYIKDLSPKSVGGWGSDFVLITVGPVLNFTLSEKSSLAVLIQFRRERLYAEPNIFANYYENRNYIGTYWYLRRVAFSYSLKL